MGAATLISKARAKTRLVLLVFVFMGSLAGVPARGEARAVRSLLRAFGQNGSTFPFLSLVGPPRISRHNLYPPVTERKRRSSPPVSPARRGVHFASGHRVPRDDPARHPQRRCLRRGGAQGARDGGRPSPPRAPVRPSREVSRSLRAVRRLRRSAWRPLERIVLPPERRLPALVQLWRARGPHRLGF